MNSPMIVKGRLITPTTVELDEPVTGSDTDVEVILRPHSSNGTSGDGPISEFLRNLPDGTRGKQDIDVQVQSERVAWNER